MQKKSVLLFTAVIAGIALAGAVLASGNAVPDAVTKLMDGNKRFVAGTLPAKSSCDAKRKELTGGQHPSAIIVTCSDSRVPPELIFDSNLGELFVIRVAGNVIDPVTLGSIEYAAEHLHSPLLVLMGHEKCGAVTAAVEATGHAEGNIGAIVNKIMPAVERAKKQGGSKEEITSNAIRQNVFQSYYDLLNQSPELKHLIEKGDLKVVEAMYHLGTGEVELLKAPETAPAAPHARKKAPVGC